MLDGIPIGDLTAPTLLGIAVLLIFLGRIVPRFTYDEKKEEAERWRLAYEAEREARATSDAQTAELLELAKTTHNIIVAVFNAQGRVSIERRRESEGSNAVFPTPN